MNEKREELLVNDMIEKEIIGMLIEAKKIQDLIRTAKTNTKKTFYQKKLNHLTPSIERTIAFYEKTKLTEISPSTSKNLSE